jgi:hypothetical protein
MTNAGIYMDKHYAMNPEFDDLLPEGTDLKDGMIVLLEDSMMRGDVDRATRDKYEFERVSEVNQWCTVSNIKITQRWERDDMGRVLSEGSPLVSFIATYPDGVKRKRTYDASYAWLVKKASIPTEAKQIEA